MYWVHTLYVTKSLPLSKTTSREILSIIGRVLQNQRILKIQSLFISAYPNMNLTILHLKNYLLNIYTLIIKLLLWLIWCFIYKVAETYVYRRHRYTALVMQHLHGNIYKHTFSTASSTDCNVMTLFLMSMSVNCDWIGSIFPVICRRSSLSGLGA